MSLPARQRDLRARVYAEYNAAFWALVYAAQPSYRAYRAGLPQTGTAAELDAERRAILLCTRRGILNQEHIPAVEHPERAAVAPPNTMLSLLSDEQRENARRQRRLIW